MADMTLDAIDHRILAALKDEGRLSNVELAERVGLSPSPCLRRVRALEGAGIITGYRAEIDRRRLGLGVMAFVEVQIVRHTEEDADAFRLAVLELPEVVACHAMTGTMDFLLQVVTTDLEGYGRFAMHRLLALPGVKDVRSSFVLQTLKG